ncbi:MAG: succinylglutamate desuccinylase/aspartoacylase family protein [Myxococcota bacterium]
MQFPWPHYRDQQRTARAPERLRRSLLATALCASLLLALAQGSAQTQTQSAADPEEVAAAPVAENVDLSEPVVEPAAPEEPEVAPPEPEPVVPEPPQPAEPQTAAVDPEASQPLLLLGEKVQSGTAARLSWSLDQRFDGITVPTPVLVVNGADDGLVLCLTAAVHGDELNGIEIVRRVMYDLDPSKLKGTVIGVPIVNLQGFRRSSRYLPDRRDLNRFFPGTESGSSASRIAYSFFNEVIANCDALVDIHTGSFQRTNLPQLRADMSVPTVAALTEGFGATAVLHSQGAIGTLRRAAVEAGIPAVTLETGEPVTLQEKEIDHATKGIQTLLNKLGMYTRVRIWGEPEPVYYQSTWVRADRGGLLFGDVILGQRVKKGQVLGSVTDPITNVRSDLTAPSDGRVLGMALNQVVMPGFAAFRIGIQTTESGVLAPGGEPGPEDDLGETSGAAAPAAPDPDLDVEDENS